MQIVLAFCSELDKIGMFESQKENTMTLTIPDGRLP